MNKRKLIMFSMLFLFSVVIFLPPIIHGYVYPNIGDDTAAHMNILDRIGFFAIEDVDTIIPEIRYCAYYIVGYPLDAISHIFNVSNDTLFLWFNYLALWGVGISLFFIFKNLIGLSAGLLALLVPMFTSYSILLLFYSGVIFNIINIGIILPFACFCAIKWFKTRKKRFAIGAICLSFLFAVFHSTGIYLPFILMAGFVSFIVYKVARREPISKWGILGMVVVASGCSIMFVFFNPIWDSLFRLMVAPSEGIWGLPLLQASLLHYMSYFVLAILIASIFFLFGKYKQILPNEKLTIAVFSILAVIMLPAILFGLSPYPMRQGYDFAIFLSIVVVVLLGIVIRLDRQRVVAILLVLVALGGAVPHISNWLGGYNSALEKVDIRAIHYVNSLLGDYFSCSDNVDHWIYDRYVEKDYLPLEGEILITRNVPMKSKIALVEDGDLILGRKILNKFADGDIEIIIYR